MSRPLEARLVRLEGIEPPCVLILPHGEKPEELVIDFSRTKHAKIPKNQPTTYRLVPSSAHDPEPLYRELFDE